MRTIVSELSHMNRRNKKPSNSVTCYNIFLVVYYKSMYIDEVLVNDFLLMKYMCNICNPFKIDFLLLKHIQHVFQLQLMRLIFLLYRKF
jgi:hypothetical protein